MEEKAVRRVFGPSKPVVTCMPTTKEDHRCVGAAERISMVLAIRMLKIALGTKTKCAAGDRNSRTRFTTFTTEAKSTAGPQAASHAKLGPVFAGIPGLSTANASSVQPRDHAAPSA